MNRRTSNMTRSLQHEHLRDRLRHEGAHLRSALSEAEARLRQLNATDVSQADETLTNCDLEYLTNAYNRQRERLQSIVESLERIEEGTFGLCVGCDEPIGEKRLKAMPSARFCISCQEELEQGARYPVASGNALLSRTF